MRSPAAWSFVTRSAFIAAIQHRDVPVAAQLVRQRGRADHFVRHDVTVREIEARVGRRPQLDHLHPINVVTSEFVEP